MSNLVVDLWQTFDFTTLDATNLAANDNTTLGSWGVTDPNSRLSTTAASETLLPGTVNTSLNDASGTRGLSYALTGTAFQEATVDYTFNSSKSKVSFGFWYRFPTGYVGSFEGGQPDILYVQNATATRELYIKLVDANQASFLLFTETQGESALINVSPDTWYWITALYDSTGGSHKLRVYDTSGNLVGSEQTRTGSTQAATIVQFGNLIGDESGVTGAAFEHDDLVMDWTSGTFPLGPPAGDPAWAVVSRTVLDYAED